MQMSDYQILASETGIYPPGCSLFYPIIGLAGEVGEVCEKIKKVYRDDGGILKEEKRQALRAPVNGSCRDLGPGEHPFDRAERNLAGQLRLDG